MMAKARDSTSGGAAPLFPRDSIYDLQRSVHGVELLALLSPPDGVSDKRLSKFVETAFHPSRPWIAGVEPKGTGVVWNYETKEVVTEFSLEVSLDADSTDDDATAAAPPPPPPLLSSKTSGLLAKSASPTATTYMRSNKSKGGALRMLFYDHEAIAATTQTATPRVCFDESIVVLTATNVVLCDMNQNAAIRSVSPDDLHRQAPCSIALLPSGLLAIGCQDGKVRVWSPQLWRVVDTIDTGSMKDVQHLLFLPSQTLDSSCSRSESSAPSNTAQHLLATTLDGKVVTWRVAVVQDANSSSTSVEATKVGDTELKDALKAFDASSGVSELKLHAHHAMLSAATRDGTVFFFDLAPLMRHARSPSLMGILPASKLLGALVVPGPRKASFVVLSIAASNSAIVVSELAIKGRLVGRDVLATSVHEFAITASSESKDLKQFINQTPALIKKLKILSLTSSCRDGSDLCALTTLGLVALRACCLPDVRPAFIARGKDRAPLLAYPSTAKVTLRFVGEETSPKQEDHRLQSGSDAPTEKLRTPLLLSCPSDASYLAAILPASQHMEILHLDAELRNQKTISITSLFSGNAIALAWHATQSRFAALVPLDVASRRRTRAQSSAHITPRRRGFMFGSSTKNVGDDTGSVDARQRTHAARLMALAVFDVERDHVEMVEENCAGTDDRLLHIFSGPLLGVVRFEVTDDDTSSSGGGGVSSSRSITDSASSHHDSSPSSMTRTRRTESSVFAAITAPSFGGSASSSSAAAAAAETTALATIDTSDIKKTVLEFYDWRSADPQQRSNSSSNAPTKPPTLNDTLRRVGSALECPLALSWETATHRFCALAYPTCVRIVRVTAAPPDVVCLHEIATAEPVQSLAWVHHTLFIATADNVTCCVVSKTRCFTFDIASRFAVDTAAQRDADDAALHFPQPQYLPSGATTILSVHNGQLLLAGLVHALHAIDLSNRVLQCCLLVSRGHEALALPLAETLDAELTDWFGTVFEAFGCVRHALQLSRLSLALKINICIKHNLLDDLEQLLATPQRDSLDTTGTSLFQRGFTSLHRGRRASPSLAMLVTMLLAAKRRNDAVFAATLLQDHELLLQAYAARDDWRAAHRVASQRTGSNNSSSSNSSTAADMCIAKWNADLATPTASWRVLLAAQQIRAPDTITLAASGL